MWTSSKRIFSAVILGFFAFSSAVFAASSSSYQINEYVLDAGGDETSSSTSYQLDDSISFRQGGVSTSSSFKECEGFPAVLHGCPITTVTPPPPPDPDPDPTPPGGGGGGGGPTPESLGYQVEIFAVTPTPNAVDVPSGVSITFKVKDEVGVNKSSIVLKVDGEIVPIIVTGDTKEYYVTFTPPEGFKPGDEIDIEIDAESILPSVSLPDNHRSTFKIIDGVIVPIEEDPKEEDPIVEPDDQLKPVAPEVEDPKEEVVPKETPDEDPVIVTPRIERGTVPGFLAVEEDVLDLDAYRADILLIPFLEHGKFGLSIHEIVGGNLLLIAILALMFVAAWNFFLGDMVVAWRKSKKDRR